MTGPAAMHRDPGPSTTVGASTKYGSFAQAGQRLAFDVLDQHGRTEPTTDPGALLPVVDHVEVVEAGWTLGEAHHFLGERIGLGHSRVLHCRFIRLEEQRSARSGPDCLGPHTECCDPPCASLCRFLVLIADFL